MGSALALLSAVVVLGAAPASATVGSAPAHATQPAAGAVAKAAPHARPAQKAATAKAVTYAPTGCNKPSKSPDVAQCMSLVVTGSDHTIHPNVDGPPSSALGPADIRSAYDLPDGGAGATVAIVDAYGDSNAEADLGVFRSHYGLSACTAANGCFRKVDQRGGTDYPVDDTGWAEETSLDLDAVSSACPRCNILLVEGDSPSLDDLGTAVDEAVSLGARYVSNSYGADEDPSTADPAADAYYDHPGVAITVSSGDDANVVKWPSSDPNVVSVGGTLLAADSSTPRGWDESAWNRAGSGCSQFQSKPAWQSADGIKTGCAYRATADISADADPASGLAVYDTLGDPGWMQFGGTSLASPLVAAAYALAGQPAPGVYPVQNLYDPAHVQHLFDVTTGTNGDCGTLLCQAGPGWDGPTGLGTPDGVDGLVSGPHGDIVGTVTDSATGKPIAGATVGTVDGYQVTTDASGRYDLRVLAGTYTVTAKAYGYAQASTSGVAVGDGANVTENLALTSVGLTTVSGTVRDGSGHGWPLYASISVDGTPLGTVYTDARTGRYSLKIPAQSTFTMHVTPIDTPGYDEGVVSVDTGTTGEVTKDVALTVDATACAAPGYGWNGTSEDFTGWTGAAKDGWTAKARTANWSFADVGDRPAPPPIPDGTFALADSARHGRMDATLTSPAVNLSGQAAPHLTFDTAYYASGRDSRAEVDLSLDGGHSWKPVWTQSSANALGHVDLAVPQAAGQSAVRFRFHYTATHGWWWSVDGIFLGTHTCVPLTGGIVEGTVAGPDGPFVGATVTGPAGTTPAVTIATPDDPAVADGFYRLFTPGSGTTTLTATADGAVSATASVPVTADGIVWHDWKLAAK